LDGALNTTDQHRARTIRGATRHGLLIGASDGRRHVIEQAGKEAHGVTAIELRHCPYV
jgi:hypothetical protein